MEHYHQIIPEALCERTRAFISRLILPEIDWDIKTAERPLEEEKGAEAPLTT